MLLAKKIARGTHRNVNYVSKLFQPHVIAPKDRKVKDEDCLSKSQKVGVCLFVVFLVIGPTFTVQGCP
jgi:hypothetical protein